MLSARYTLASIDVKFVRNKSFQYFLRTMQDRRLCQDVGPRTSRSSLQHVHLNWFFDRRVDYSLPFCNCIQSRINAGQFFKMTPAVSHRDKKATAASFT